MSDFLAQIFSGDAWWNFGLRTLGFFIIGWVIHKLSLPFAKRLLKLSRFTPEKTRPSPERQQTLENLIASSITVVAFIGAIMATLLQVISPDTLVWVVGLFSAAFGLGARPQLSDFLSGVGFLFEDTFSVGEKVEILTMEGVIESVNLRTTLMRSSSGELYVIPNGEIRVVRNFSRGHFSTADVKLKINTEDLDHVLAVLEKAGHEALISLPNLIEPWQVISESGTVGKHTELTLVANARFGKGADMRPRLLKFVDKKLSDANIKLVD